MPAARKTLVYVGCVPAFHQLTDGAIRRLAVRHVTTARPKSVNPLDGLQDMMAAMRPVDRTDLAILRAMGVYPFNRVPHGPNAVRPSALAKRLGLSMDLVKDRVARMEESGIILGYQIHPNLHHLGLREAILHTDVPLENRDRFYEEVKLIDGIVGLCRYVGDSACIDMRYRSPSELERKARHVMSLMGRHAPPDRYAQLGATTPTRRLTNLDWRIIRTLRGNAKQSYSQIAQKVEASPRTVRRRLDRMDEDNAIDVVVEPDFGAVSGAIIFVIQVRCAGAVKDTTWSAVLDIVQDRCFMRLKPDAPEVTTFIVDSFAFSQGEVEETRAAVAQVPGVDRVELFFPASENVSGEWLDDAIDAMVQQTDPTLSGFKANDPGFDQNARELSQEPSATSRTQKS